MFSQYAHTAIASLIKYEIDQIVRGKNLTAVLY